MRRRASAQHLPARPSAGISYPDLCGRNSRLPSAFRSGRRDRSNSSRWSAKYPEKFRTAAVTKHLFDAEFEISIAAKPAARADVMYVAGCLFRAAGFMTLVLYALNRKFFLNEKGAFAESRGFAIKPARFHDTVASVLGQRRHDASRTVGERRSASRAWLRNCGNICRRARTFSSGCVLSARARFRDPTLCARARRACRTSACPWRGRVRLWRVRF